MGDSCLQLQIPDTCIIVKWKKDFVDVLVGLQPKLNLSRRESLKTQVIVELGHKFNMMLENTFKKIPDNNSLTLQPD